MGAVFSACSCALSCCSCLSSCLRCSKTSSRARLQYFGMFFLAAVIAWILRDHGYQGLKHVGDMKHCGNEDCTGTGIVLRISLAMVLVSSLLCVLVFGVNNSSNPRAAIQNDLFLVKWLLLAVTVVGCMFISNESAIQYGYVAAVGSGFFLVIGIILVLEFAYGWNDSWVAKYDATGARTWAYLVLICAFLTYATSITVWVLLLVYYGGDNCDDTNAFVAVTIVLSIGVTALSLPAKIEQGAILPCGVVVLYCTWLCASAVTSIPIDNDSACQGRHSSHSHATNQAFQSLGIIFTLFCVGYATIRAASSGQDLSGGSAKPTKTTLLDNEAAGAGESTEVTKEAEDDEADTVQYNYSYFQAIYALGAMYLAMVLIDWDITIADKHHHYGSMSAWGNVWIKMATQWVTFALYIWSLIAPLVCTSRQFD